MKAIALTLLAMLLCTTAAFAGSFQDNGNGTVTDLTTNLMWQKCSYGQTYNQTNNDCSNNNPAATKIAWDSGTPSAISCCEDLSLCGFTDWRLPNATELSSLVDDSRSSPAINITYFPSTQLWWYWSSTTFVHDTANALIVAFDSGTMSSAYSKTAFLFYVRCVRGQ